MKKTTFKKTKQGNAQTTALSVECAPQKNPFGILDSCIPLSTVQNKLYQTLRESVPVIDCAIYKIIHLVGGFEVKTESGEADKALSAFLKSVRVNSNQQGAEAFVSGFLNSLLTYGTAVGEMVMNSQSEIAALYNVPLDALELRQGKSPLDIKIYSRSGLNESLPVKHPERIIVGVLNPEPGQLTGNSLLKGLPFVSSVLLQIYNTIGVNFERIGNIRFAVNYKPGDNPLDKNYAAQRAKAIASEWGTAMHSGGSVKDFVCVGDVDIKVIGADNQIIDTEVPVRQMLEQIVAKTGLPPFMLGLNWSSTERMSSQQADLLTSELESYRRIITPVISKIALTFLRTNGYADDIEVVWNNITLQDEVELARARLYNAQASKLEKNEGVIR